VARGSDRKRIIRIRSALAFFRVYHDSIGTVPVKFPKPTPPAGFEGTRSGFETSREERLVEEEPGQQCPARKRKTP
jgi:hypothetical protein